MNGVIILFQFPEKTDHNMVNKFMQKFYGQDSTSWKGGYRYHRHGFLEDIPHRELLCGVIILRIEDKDRVPDFLGKYVLTSHVREIKLAADDEKKLGKYHE
ncbi:MAG: hypothetical protein AAE977_06055 [Thermoplasmataceae archaeon]|jgi:hypothetical protein